MDLRYYQHEAIHGGSGYPGIYQCFREGDSALLDLATGTGKTIVFAKVAEDCVRKGRRVMIIAHRKELIQQARDKLIRSTSIDSWDIGVEMAGDHAGDHHKVVVGSVQTLASRRLQKFRAAEFGLLVVDEAHHAVASSYQPTLEHFAGSKILGVTATPDRKDGKSLLKVFKRVAYVYDIAGAIEDQFLVDITGEVIHDGSAIDISGVRKTAGDLNLSDLSKAMMTPQALALVAKGIVEKSEDRPTMGFAVDVAHAKAIAQMINLIEPGTAMSVHGKSKPGERERAIDFLSEGKNKRRVINCGLFTEGTDIEAISCVAIARMTGSRGLYSQMIGRGTRLLGSTFEESKRRGKVDCHILDFSGVTGRHKLANCLGILDSAEDAEVSLVALERLKKGKERISDALKLAESEVAEEEKRKALERIKLTSQKMMDPFTILGVRPRRGKSLGRPATIAQLEVLAKHNIPGAQKALNAYQKTHEVPVTAPDFHQSDVLIRAIRDRARSGLCSVRMARTLGRHGLNPDVPFDIARAVISKFEAARWKPSPHLIGQVKAEFPELSVRTDERQKP